MTRPYKLRYTVEPWNKLPEVDEGAKSVAGVTKNSAGFADDLVIVSTTEWEGLRQDDVLVAEACSPLELKAKLKRAVDAIQLYMLRCGL